MVMRGHSTRYLAKVKSPFNKSDLKGDHIRDATNDANYMSKTCPSDPVQRLRCIFKAYVIPQGYITRNTVFSSLLVVFFRFQKDDTK